MSSDHTFIGLYNGIKLTAENGRTKALQADYAAHVFP